MHLKPSSMKEILCQTIDHYGQRKVQTKESQN